jgi:alkyl sulfatase BDS1-like metallo-beta-lactamase superfamily hydrolase
MGGVPEDIPIIAPEHFMEEAVSENVLAGPVMLQRAGYMYGSSLPRSPTGQMGVGLAMGTSGGTTSLIPPTLDIKKTGHVEVLDGVEYVFQMVPETEAPAELNIYFPKEKALLIAECAVPAMHNITTLRGALVRDAKAWSRYLDESLSLYCEPEEGGAEVLFASHGWPTWGNTEIRRYLEDQRDLYGYMHDQTVKLMNEGYNGTEIAEKIALPPRLGKAWHTQGFYGSMNHNVKGIYQRYMTWFDGRAENLWKWPPTEEGKRYVECMGGVDGVIARAEEFISRGDLRFASTLLAHVVAAGDRLVGEEEAKTKASAMLADVFERLGFGAENATWRNFYLSQALELRDGGRPQPGKKFRNRVPFRPGVPVEHWLGALSVRIDGEAAGKETMTLQTDLIVKAREEEAWRLILSNGVLTYRRLTMQPDDRAKVVVVEKQDLCGVFNSAVSLESVAVVRTEEIQVLGRIFSYAGIGLQRQNSSNL